MIRQITRRLRRFASDERGVSIAVTHVLAIGITTLLISALLVGAAGVLSQQRDQAADRQLDRIGNRLATQIAKADSLVGTDEKAESATFRVDQPGKVSGGSYSVRLADGDVCEPPADPPHATPDACLVLTPSNPELDIDPVQVPVHNDSEVTLEDTGNGEFVITVENP